MTFARIIVCPHQHFPASTFAHINICPHRHLPASTFARIGICLHWHLPASTFARINICLHRQLPTSTIARIGICPHLHLSPATFVCLTTMTNALAYSAMVSFTTVNSLTVQFPRICESQSLYVSNLPKIWCQLNKTFFFVTDTDSNKLECWSLARYFRLI